MATQQDFRAECSALQHAVEERIIIQYAYGDYDSQRHKCLFLPKFHCELNWIERMWGACKSYCRSHCLYSLQGLRETVPSSLSQSLTDLPHIDRRHRNYIYRRMHQYNVSKKKNSS